MFPLKLFVTLLFAINAVAYPVVKVDGNSTQLHGHQINGSSMQWIGIGPCKFSGNGHVTLIDTSLNATTKAQLCMVHFSFLKKPSGETVFDVTAVEHFDIATLLFKSFLIALLFVAAGFLALAFGIACVYAAYVAFERCCYGKIRFLNR